MSSSYSKAITETYMNNRKYKNMLNRQNSIQIVTKKVCNLCKIEKETCNFAKNITSIDDFDHVCKECTNKRAIYKRLQDKKEVLHKYNGTNEKDTILYFLKFEESEYVFFKIGVTKRDISKRFNKKEYEKYKITVLHTEMYTEKMAYNIEYVLLQEHYSRGLFYDKIVNIKFSGWTECLSELNLDILQKNNIFFNNVSN